jgi:hypothetical protein
MALVSHVGLMMIPHPVEASCRRRSTAKKARNTSAHISDGSFAMPFSPFCAGDAVRHGELQRHLVCGFIECMSVLGLTEVGVDGVDAAT